MFHDGLPSRKTSAWKTGKKANKEWAVQEKRYRHPRPKPVRIEKESNKKREDKTGDVPSKKKKREGVW